MMSSRTARHRARFFLPALRRGMRVLDVGSGPGTITLGLASRVAPGGAVVGIDLEESQVEFAQREATRAGERNVAFQSARSTRCHSKTRASTECSHTVSLSTSRIRGRPLPN